ncbi:MAG: VTT domain-containing protein, partial [Limisphaerales bacterium]
MTPAPLPEFGSWTPVAQAAALGLATFVQEDIPTVTAALLAGTGKMAWLTAFLGCFLGIWIGDALLYGVARAGGRPLLRSRWAGRLATPEAVTRSEAWFQKHGVWLLLVSRFVPGTRLPTYLAAGFLRLPFGRFLLVTGLAVAVWTGGIFGLAAVLGARLEGVLSGWSHAAWLAWGGALAGLAALRLLPRFLRSARWARWTRWEFWPAWLFYLPVAAKYLQLSVRHRSLTLPTAANPGLEAGGLVGESKFATLADLWRTSPEFTAEAWQLAAGPAEERLAVLRRLAAAQGLAWPFVLKPDIGQRGAGVKLVRGEADAAALLRHTSAPLVVQRYVAGPLEAGLFYVRQPHEARGRLFAITEKIFPTVTGDGVRTVEELIRADDRARCVADRYLARFAARRGEVLPAGETLRLVEAGNHAQGCVFRDGARLWSPELEA